MIKNKKIIFIGIPELNFEQEKRLRTYFSQIRIYSEIKETAKFTRELRGAEAICLRGKPPFDFTAYLDRCRLINVAATNYNSVDLVRAKKKGIFVSYVPSYGAASIAEFFWAMALILARKLNYFVPGDFPARIAEGRELRGRNVGIICRTYNEKTKELIRLARCFQASVFLHFFDSASNMPVAGCQFAGYKQLLKKSDFIFVLLHDSDGNGPFLRGKDIDLIKSGSIVVSFASGGIFDEAALRRRIKKGEIFFGTDDISGLGIAGKISNFPNVFITPNLSWNTKEAKEELVNASIDNILGFLSGRPRNLILS